MIKKFDHNGPTVILELQDLTVEYILTPKNHFLERD